MKVVIVDLKGRYAAALAENGEIKRIVNNHYEIGQEIELYDIKEVRQPRFAPRVIRRVVAVAAAVIVLAIGSMATAYAIPYGTVSLESDPSIEYTINCFDYVIGVKALNDNEMEKDGYPDAENGSVAINVNTPDNDRTDRMKDDLNNRFNGNSERPTETAENQQAKEQTPNSDQNDRQQEQQNGNAQQNETPQGQNNDQPQAENNSPQQDNSSDQNQSGEPMPNRSDQGDPLLR